MKKMAIWIILLAATLTLAMGCTGETETTSTNNTLGYRQVSAEEAKKLMDSEKGYVILDVRTQEEYEEGHIPDVVLLPDFEVEQRAAEQLPDKGQLILVYCRSGNRSKSAASTLVNMGYTNVVEFGGIRDWPYDVEK